MIGATDNNDLYKSKTFYGVDANTITETGVLNIGLLNNVDVFIVPVSGTHVTAQFEVYKYDGSNYVASGLIITGEGSDGAIISEGKIKLKLILVEGSASVVDVILTAT